MNSLLIGSGGHSLNSMNHDNNHHHSQVSNTMSPQPPLHHIQEETSDDRDPSEDNDTQSKSPMIAVSSHSRHQQQHQYDNDHQVTHDDMENQHQNIVSGETPLLLSLRQTIASMSLILSEVNREVTSALSTHYYTYKDSFEWRLFYYRLMVINHYSDVLYCADLTESIDLPEHLVDS